MKPNKNAYTKITLILIDLFIKLYIRLLFNIYVNKTKDLTNFSPSLIRNK